MKELQRKCTQSKGRSTAHGQTKKLCTFYREVMHNATVLTGQKPNIILFKRSCSKSGNTRFYTKGEPAWANYVLMPKILLHLLTADKKLWLHCNNLFLPSLAMLNQGSCQKYPLDMKAVTYLKTMHLIFKCISVWQFGSTSVFLQCPVSVTFHNLLAHTFKNNSITDMCF